MRAHILLARSAESLSELGIVEDLEAALWGFLSGADQESRHAVLDLEWDPADVPGDCRPALPERFRDRQPESLACRLLHHDVRLRLECVYLDRPDVVQVVEDLDVGVVGR